MFVKYISKRMKDKSDVDRCGGNGSTYFLMGVAKTNNDELGGIITDSNNYAGKVNHIEISHERARRPSEPLTENEQAALRPELGRLMWIARITSPGAIYAASAAAQTFSDGGDF